MKLWGLKVKGALRPVGLRTRDDVRDWAARRMMAARTYEEICGAYFRHQRSMRLWEAVKFNHPTARIVRLQVRDGEKHG